MNVAVVGGGAVGVTVARDLADRGAAVTLYERGDLAAGSSGRAAGVCYDAFADRRDARIAERALERFRELDGTGDFAFTGCPYVWLAREGDDERAAAVRGTAAQMVDNGLDVATVDPASLGERFPALRTDDVAVAAVAEGAGHVDTAAYVEAMGERAREAGVDVRTETPVTVRTDPTRVVEEEASHASPGEDSDADAVVVAAGAHTPSLLAEAGVQVPVKPYRVQALVARERHPAPICFDATGGFYLRPHPEGVLVGDGTEPVAADPDGYDRAADGWFREEMRDALRERLGVDATVARAWAGLCTATPDGDPLVGPVGDGLYVATGFQGHGFMRAPAIGEALAGQVLGDEGIRGFDPGRFDGDEAFEIREGMAME